MKLSATEEALQDGLPEEIRQVIELKRQQKNERLAALAKIVAKRRSDAVAAKKTSGIDRIWKEDEEFYLGIDEANRATHAYTKSMNADGGLSSNTNEDNAGKCTAFFNITRQFVDSASARMGDILLPATDWNFTIRPTPVPDLDKVEGSDQPVVDPATGAAKANPDGTPYTLGQFAAEEKREIDERTQKAELRIRDWLTECQYHAEVRKVIEDAAKIGTGVLRGAYPEMKKTRVVRDNALIIEDKVVPTSKRVDPRNFFPDPSCGDNIQNGSFVLERDYLSARQLRELKSMDGYIASNIDKVLGEGAQKSNVDADGNLKDQSAKIGEDDRYEVWYYFGLVDIDDLNALDAVKEDDEPGKDLAPAVVVMVNDTVIRGFVNPLDNGEFPYDVMAWQRQSDTWTGVGVARQGRTAQEMLNGAARRMMRNAGLASGAMLVIRKSAITPADGEWTIVPDKIWYATEEADIRSVADAIQSIIIPSMQQELSNIIQMAYKMMEDSTGVSFLLQGQQGSAPDTVGGMQLLHQNSSALLRRIARVFDESITEPHIRRYYDWLLIHGEDDEKGDLQIEAVGSTALVEREIQSQQAAQILQMAMNPAFGYSPKKAADELLRAWRFEPSKFEMDEQEKQAVQQQQPAPAPQIQAAQIRAQTDEKIAQMRNDADVEKMRMDMDRDTAYNQSVMNRDQMTFEQRSAELQLRKELAMMEYANRHQITLENVKAGLAETAMKLRTQKELALSADGGAQVITPPVEIPGRAENGHAYEQ